MELHALRKQIRKQRRKLSNNQQTEHAASLNQQLQTLAQIQTAQRLGLYLVNDGEIDPEPFMRWAWRAGKACYLPVLSRHKNQAMQFAAVTANSMFIPNRFNILEPKVKQHELVLAEALDLILMPLVAFDLQGNRIGMGGGFYDRTLAFKRRQPYHQPPLLFGLAHAFQQQPCIEPSTWDVPMDGVITEQHALIFNR